MKRSVISTLMVLVWMVFAACSAAFAAGDGYYTATETTTTWDGTDGNVLTNTTTDYDYVYGDEESVTYTLPWAVTFYGRSYSTITADTNGNVWFSATDAAYSFDLVNTGRGPVISGWNSDLSSAFHGGVFIQHKVSPERVVIEWQTETYTEEGLDSPNNFEVVIYTDGSIRFDYKSFATQYGADLGSGTSRGDGLAALSLTSAFGDVFALAGRSFMVLPQPLMAVNVSKDGLGGGTVTSVPSVISCGTVCNGNFAQGTSVTLTATPDFGSVFDGWSGGCTGMGTCTINLDAAKSVTALFSQTYAPQVAISAPVGTMAINKPVLNYVVSTGTVVVKVDGTVVDKVSGAALDTLSEGSHVLRVEATNSAGHMGFAESSFTVDTTPPVVASITPAAGSNNVPVRMPILVRFSEQTDPASITSGMVSLTSRGIQIPGVVTLSSDGISLIFKANSTLAYGATYTLTLKAGVRDQLGNTINSDLTSTFSTLAIDPDLVGYWPMDGDWNDYSGSGNNGTAYGSAAFADGRISGTKASNFVIDSKIYSGSGGIVFTPAKYLASAANTFTMAFWAKPTGTRDFTTETNFGISGPGIQRFAIAPTNMAAFAMAGAGAGVSVGTNGVSVYELTNDYLPSLLVYDAPTPFSGWNHIAVVYTNKQPSLYVNGQYVKTGQTSQQSTIYPSANFGDTDTGYGAYSGQMGEVAIYKRALSAQEIQTLYQNSNRQMPEISITSTGQSVKYKPGESGSATVTATSATGMTKLYCSASGTASAEGLALYFDPPQPQTTQQLGFQVAPNAAPYASYLLTCAAQTSEGVFGVGELALQAADTVPPTVANSTPANNAIDVSSTMPLTITFSEPMDRTSFVSRDTFKFQRTDNGTFVTGLSGFLGDGKTLAIIPSPALDAATSYTITISGVRDLAGNTLVNDYTLQFTTLQQSSLTIDGKGTSASPYVLSSGRYGTLVLNNSYVSIGGGVTADSVTITNSTVNVTSGTLGVPGDLSAAYGDMVVTGSQVTVNGTVNVSGSLNQTSSTMSITGNVTVTHNLAMSSSSLTLKNPMTVTGNVTIQNQSVLTHFSATTSDTSRVDITAGSMSVDATSKIDVSGKGYLGGFQGGNNERTGRTLGNTTTGASDGKSGGSYGGNGGIGGYGNMPANAVYGDLTDPNNLGSGGSGYIDVDVWGREFNLRGGNGGGLVRITTQALILNGAIAADGATDVIGGGSGGGIRIDSGSIAGNGRISVKGGASTGLSTMWIGGGGGGGGRIAVCYDIMTLPTGNIVASGGSGSNNIPSQNGGAGTVLLKDNAKSYYNLIIVNGGVISNNTTPVPSGDFIIVNAGDGATITMGGNFITNQNMALDNAKLTIIGSLSLPGNLLLTNSSITISGGLTVAGDLTLTNSALDTSGIATIVGNLALSGSSLSANGALSLNGSMSLSNSNMTLKDTLNPGGLTPAVNLTLDNSTITMGGAMNVTGTLTLKNNSVLTHMTATATAQYKLDVTAGSISVDDTSKIDVTGRGYLGAYQGNNTTNTGMTFGNTTTGGSSSAAGGSYGGMAGISSWSNTVNTSYGSIQQPNEVGSGGGANNSAEPGGNGGGLAKITAGSLSLNGGILANGANSYNGGGGGGGGIYINVGNLTGAGRISAQGEGVPAYNGNINFGAGGGGRIAIYYNTNTLPITNIVASGGKSGNGSNSNRNGGAGTIYLKDNAQAKGDLTVNNGGVSAANATVVPGGDYGLIDISGGAKIAISDNLSLDKDVVISNAQMTFLGGIVSHGNFTLNNSTVTVSDAVTITNTFSIINSTLTVSAGIIACGNLTINNSSLTADVPINVTGSLVLKNNGLLTHSVATTAKQFKLDITAGDISVELGSKIDVSNKGYLGGSQGGNTTKTGMTTSNPAGGSSVFTGTTTGGSTVNSGGSYGGMGGVSLWNGNVNATYGNPRQPDEIGSGGGSGNAAGNGGGLIKITAGTLNLDGNILANGGSVLITGTTGGGGSGGGISLKVGDLSGTGTISASGGNVQDFNNRSLGAGGGGRIAIYYNSNSMPLSNITASGGLSGDGITPIRNGGMGSILITTQTMNLNITKAGTGSGMIVSSPDGISCGTTCSYQFATFGTVTLTVAPAPGSTFTGWSGACSGSGACTVTMDAAKDVTATFADTFPPTVIISSPSGITKNSRPPLLYTASGGTVVVKVDGTIVNKVSGNTLDTLTDGIHHVRVEATNSTGKTGFAETIVTIDTIPPALSVSTLTDGSYTNNEVLNISGTVTDTSGVKELTINGVPVALNTDGSFSHALVLSYGKNTIEVKATDLAINATSDTRTISLDQKAPLLVVTSPADNSMTNQPLVDVTGYVDETSTVEVSLKGVLQPVTMDGDTFTSTVALLPGADPNTVSITAIDLAMNPSSDKRSIYYDDQTPSLAITEPGQDIRTNQANITIQGAASDPYGFGVTIGIEMDGQKFAPPVIDGKFEQAVTFATEGTYHIVATARNEAGTSTSVPRNVIYDITPPPLTIDPVSSPTVLPLQLISGTREADILVAVTCPTAIVGVVEYPTDTTWRATLSGMVVGDNIITVQAMDAAGNPTSVYSRITLLMVDSDVAFTVAPNIIWPPNHKMVPVTIGGKLNIPTADVLSVDITLADEYGKYNYKNLEFGSVVKVEAWRNGKDMDGRFYTVTAVVTRRDGSKTATTTTVLVPHDMRDDKGCSDKNDDHRHDNDRHGEKGRDDRRHD